MQSRQSLLENLWGGVWILFFVGGAALAIGTNYVWFAGISSFAGGIAVFWSIIKAIKALLHRSSTTSVPQRKFPARD